MPRPKKQNMSRSFGQKNAPALARGLCAAQGWGALDRAQGGHGPEPRD